MSDEDTANGISQNDMQTCFMFHRLVTLADETKNQKVSGRTLTSYSINVINFNVGTSLELELFSFRPAMPIKPQ